MLQRIRTIQNTAKNNDEGFTLIELLIVIVVLGILAGIVVFGVSTFRGDATSAACKADVKSVEVAAQAYNAKTGAYPAAGAITASSPLVTLNYLKSAPTTTVTLNATGDATTTC